MRWFSYLTMTFFQLRYIAEFTHDTNVTAGTVGQDLATHGEGFGRYGTLYIIETDLEGFHPLLCQCSPSLPYQAHHEYPRRIPLLLFISSSVYSAIFQQVHVINAIGLMFHDRGILKKSRAKMLGSLSRSLGRSPLAYRQHLSSCRASTSIISS